MTVLQNSNLDLDLFYKKNDIPKITVGDKVKVTIYLELPKNLGENEKKGKERIQAFGDKFNKMQFHEKDKKFIGSIQRRSLKEGFSTENNERSFRSNRRNRESVNQSKPVLEEDSSSSDKISKEAAE